MTKLTDEQREENPMLKFARAYEMERINRVLDSLDRGVFKSLSAYADAEHFLRFARDEIGRLKASEQAWREQQNGIMYEIREIVKEANAGINGSLERADEALKRIKLLAENLSYLSQGTEENT